MADIIYPNNCPPIDENLAGWDLVLALKKLLNTLSLMPQERNGNYQVYVPLAHYLTTDFFINNPSPNVQLLVVMCVTRILRVYAPNSPYEDDDQVKSIFQFFMRLLKGLENRSDHFTYTFCNAILENLLETEAILLCNDVDEHEEFRCQLFSQMFDLLNDEALKERYDLIRKNCQLLITALTQIDLDLLNIILMKLLDGNRSQKALANYLIVNCCDNMEESIHLFFKDILSERCALDFLPMADRVDEIFFQLNDICPNVLNNYYEIIVASLKSKRQPHREKCLTLLYRLFLNETNSLKTRMPEIWRGFLFQFLDPKNQSQALRIKFLEYSQHLVKKPVLQQDIIEMWKHLHLDDDELIRQKIVKIIVDQAKDEYDMVEQNHLLEILHRRSRDSSFEVRKIAISGLASLCRRYRDDEIAEVTKMHNTIFHLYLRIDIDQRCLIEKILQVWLIPFDLKSSEQRMKMLYKMYATMDGLGVRGFKLLHKVQRDALKAVTEWLHLMKNPDDYKLRDKIVEISYLLPNSLEVREHLQRFTKQMIQDVTLWHKMEAIFKPSLSVQDRDMIIKHFMAHLWIAAADENKDIIDTVKKLMERVALLLIDEDCLKILIGYVQACVEADKNVIAELELNPEDAGTKGLKLLVILSYTYRAQFMNKDVLEQLKNLLDNPVATLPVLSMLRYVGMSSRIPLEAPDMYSTIIQICKKYITTCTPKEAKVALRCIIANSDRKDVRIIQWILDLIEKTLTPQSPHYRSSIVILGHIGCYYASNEEVKLKIRDLVKTKIYHELLQNKESKQSEDTSGRDFCREEQLSEDIRCFLEGLKCIARFLVGLPENSSEAQETYRLLNRFLEKKGDYYEQGRLSPAEMSWIRLRAGCVMLTICQHKGFGRPDAKQMYNLSQLMIDDVKDVRKIFSYKLHRGLCDYPPKEALPLDFMGFYGLAALEPDEEHKMVLRNNMMWAIDIKRSYIKIMGSSAVSDVMMCIPQVLPDYMLEYAVAISAHIPQFTNVDNPCDLEVIEKCLWFVLEPLITHENYCYSFYENLIKCMKLRHNAYDTTNNSWDWKMWSVCDVAMKIIKEKAPNCDVEELPFDPFISPTYFSMENVLQSNDESYVPDEFQLDGKTWKKRGRPRGKAVKRPGMPQKTRAAPLSKKSTR